MDAGRQEIRQQDHALGTLLDAATAGLVDGRLGLFEERGLNDGVSIRRAQPIGEVVQIVIRLGLPAAVRDQEQCGLHFASVSFSSSATRCFQTAASVCVPWPRVASLIGTRIALPCGTFLISRSRMPGSGGLIRSSAKLMASSGALILLNPGPGS